MNPVNSPDISNLTTEQKRELLAQLMQRKAAQQAEKTSEFSTNGDAKAVVDSESSAPLSFAQQRLWFIDQLQPGQAVYTIPAALRLQGHLKADILQRCLNELVARHEVLRTQFITQAGEPSQQILPEQTVELPIIDVSEDDSSNANSLGSDGALLDDDLRDNDLLTQLQPQLKALVAQPFDLATGPLMRCQLLRIGECDHVLTIAIHHIIADYWSLRIVMKEIALLYQALSNHQPSPLPLLPIQYGDYAAWQHSQQATSAHDQLSYWTKQLAHPPAFLQLPTDYPRPAKQSFEGARQHFSLSPALSSGLEHLAQRSQATLFMTLLAAFQVLLYRYSNQSDILVGSTVSNRDRAETQNLIGLFVNNLVFRAEVNATQPFSKFLQQVKSTAIAAYDHKKIPFEQVVDALNVDRQLSHNALFQVMFILHNTPQTTFALPELVVSNLALDNSAARFDWSLDMYEGDNGLTGVFEYRSDLFKADTIDRLIGHFKTLLGAIVDNPDMTIGQLPLLARSELTSLNRWNQTTAEIPALCAHEMIEAQAMQTPEAIALSVDSILANNSFSQSFTPEQLLSYQQLNAKANQLAHYLIGQGIQAGNRIALTIGRSAELVIALLAVLKLGGTYIPLDPTHPSTRLRHILQDSEANLVIEADAAFSDRFGDLRAELSCSVLDIKHCADDINQQSIENLEVSIDSQDIAYIIYTSGSTGKPKGVPIRHCSLTNLLASMAKSPGIEARDSLLAVTTVAFDIATLELLLPLTVGARLVMASAETVRDCDRLIAQLECDAITIMQATPATWRLLLDSGWKGLASLKMLCGGEALDLPLAQQLLPCGRELWNMYGPTETTIWSSTLRIDEKLLTEGFVPIGAPIDNTQFYVLNEQKQRVPVGVPGELYIGGAGLSKGYFNLPEQTADRFVESSLSSDGLLYKTGDLVRRRSGITIEYLGRFDHQVKLRGFRIELGEIETALTEHPAIAQSLVMLKEIRIEAGTLKQQEKEPQLVAYCKVWSEVSLDESDATRQSIRQHLNQHLPSYMVPTAYVLLHEFPLTPNGKIDRQSLPAPSVTSFNSASSAAALQTQTEQLLVNIWADILNLSSIGAHDNFFELGGHSLLAARVIAQVRAVFDRAVPLRSLFENSTLSSFAQVIDNTLQSQTVQPIETIDRTDELPLSYAQKRQWVLAQLEPDNPFYNIPAALRLEGNFSLPLLEQSLAILCQRHEGLRTTFTSVSGEAKLKIVETATPEISYLDMRLEARSQQLSNQPLSEEQIEQQIKDDLIAEARKPFDLEKAPLIRIKVVRTAPSIDHPSIDTTGHTDQETREDTHIVLVVLHHIIADAESLTLLMREMVHIYSQLQASAAVSLSPLPVQYVDYAAWQQRLDTTPQLEYWRRQLADAPELLALPTDFPRPATQSFEGAAHRFTLTVEQTAALKQLSAQHSVTLFMTLMAAFQTLLHRYSGADNLVVGTPISHRPQAQLESVLGMFVNTLAMRSTFSGGSTFSGEVTSSSKITFSELLQQTRQTALAAYANQDVSFEEIIDSLDIPRNWSHSPLFQVMFVWQAAKTKAIDTVDDLAWSPFLLENNTTKVDLSLSMTEEDNRLSGKFEYRQDLFKPGTIAAMSEAFVTLLASITQAPEQAIDQLSLVNSAQQQQIQQWNSTEWNYPVNEHSPDLCLHHLFEQQVKRSPHAPALITPTQTLTYKTLNEQANQLAKQLQTLGVVCESRVGICLERSANLIVAILAVLKAGGAYVPLDPTYPASRIDYILEDAQVAVLITQGDFESVSTPTPQTSFHTIFLGEDIFDISSKSLSDSNQTLQINDLQPSHLAYIIYTSGSTGAPKGVAIEHHSPVALIQWANEVYSSAQLSGVLAATSVCFDLSIFEIFAPLSCGGSVILAENILQLPVLPAADQVSLINTVPTVIAELIRLGNFPHSVSTVNLAGESIPPSLVKKLYAIDSVQQVFNLYGPSEDTTYSTYTLLSPSDAVVPIGKPIANTQAHILDAQQNLVPIGMPGELYLSGAGVARGYWNRPQLTSERFSQHNGISQYRTGDLARYRPDGQIEFLGRIDHQVKVRGFRIELGEIESALLQQAQVRQAAVRSWCDEQENYRLVAYVVFSEELVEAGTQKDTGENNGECNIGKALAATSSGFVNLRSHLQKTLPNYMLPSIIIPLKALPLLPNGKINRKALPDPVFEDKEIDEGSQSETLGVTSIEQTLVAIWKSLLGHAVGVHDNFFELGGDSILAIQAIAQAQQSGLHFSPRDLFQYPTIAQLAAIAQSQSNYAAQQTPVTGPVVLTPAQQWFFNQPLSSPHHWNQSVLLTVKQALRPDWLAQALSKLIEHHDALRATFEQLDSKPDHKINGQANQSTEENVWIQTYQTSYDSVPLEIVQSDTKYTSEEIASVIETQANEAQTSFNLRTGPLLKVVYYDLQTEKAPERRLLIVCHHLVIDGISWRILLNDLQLLYQQLSDAADNGKEIDKPEKLAFLPPKTSSVSHWSNYLSSSAAADKFAVERDYWQQIATTEAIALPQNFKNSESDTKSHNLMGTADTLTVKLSKQETNKLLKEVPNAYSISVEDILLTALALTLNADSHLPLKIWLEGHGRPEDQDFSRTVGWFTTLYPVLLQLPTEIGIAEAKTSNADPSNLGAAMKAVKETLRAVPHQGIGYGVLRYSPLEDSPDQALETSPPVRFNYLGQTDQLFSQNQWLTPATESTGTARSPEDPRDVLIEINAVVSRQRLKVHWTYSQALHKRETLATWASTYLNCVNRLIDYCLLAETDQGYSPTDFPQMGLEQGELDDLLMSLGGDAL
ncbi:MAG: amino acid adenylation domain-containing protein [Cyanobacteria bacterium J06621_11]